MMQARESVKVPRQRRGGFGDAGGVAHAAGELPAATPLEVGSQAELAAELERIAAALKPTTDWVLRVDALLRLEGLLAGGAAQFATLPELLLYLRDPLASQMQERRSAVSRQTCHVVALLAAECGASFEPLAVHLLPCVLKALAMGIQVVSEAALGCGHTLVRYCPTARLLPRLCTMVATDKNGRLRLLAAGFLLQALDEWEAGGYERQAEEVERAILAAAQDPQGDTRALGRTLFAAYSRAWPGRAHTMLMRLDKALQEKLASGLRSYVPGAYCAEGMACMPRVLSRTASAASSGGGSQLSGSPTALARTGSGLPAWTSGAARVAPPVPRLALSSLTTVGSPSGAAGSARQAAPWQLSAGSAAENQPENQAGVQATPRSLYNKPPTARQQQAPDPVAAAAEAEGRQPSARGRICARRSMGGAALRVNMAAARQEVEAELAAESACAYTAAAPGGAAAALTLGVAALGPRRVSVSVGALRVLRQPASGALHPAAQHPAADWPLTARRGAQGYPGSIAEESDASEVGSMQYSLAAEDHGSYCLSGAPTGTSVPQLLGGLAKAGADWSDRVTLYQGLVGALQHGRPHALGEVAANTDRLAAVLLEGVADAHFRVAGAALAALAAALAGPSARVFEPHLDRFVPALFARVGDPREQVHVLVAEALGALPEQYGGEATMAAAARALAANKAPRVKCAVLEYLAGLVAALEGQQQQEQWVQEAAAEAAGEEAGQQQAGAVGGGALPGALRSMLQLAVDKHLEIRRTAVRSLAAIYQAGQQAAVLGALNALPPAELLAAQRALAPAIPGLERAAGAARQHSRAAATAAAHGGLAARRHSGEGLPAFGAQQGSSPGGGRRVSAEGAAGLHPRWAGGSLTAREAGASPLGRTVSAGAVFQQAVAAAAECAPPAAQPPSPLRWQQQPEPAPAAEQPVAAAAVLAPVLPAAAAVVDAERHEEQDNEQAWLSTAVAAAPCVEELGTAEGSATESQLRRLLAQLQGGGAAAEVLQGISRMAPTLPAAAWPAYFAQVLPAAYVALDSGAPPLRVAALGLVRDLARVVDPPALLPALPALLPRLLGCMAAEAGAREVVVAADAALGALLARAPPEACLPLLAARLPAPGAPPAGSGRPEGALLHAAICCAARAAARLRPASLAPLLGPELLPGLAAAFCSPLADVRKATVDCLVAIWLVMGDALLPHLEQLSASQMKLLQIYHERARSTAQAAAGGRAYSALPR